MSHGMFYVVINHFYSFSSRTSVWGDQRIVGDENEYVFGMTICSRMIALYCTANYSILGISHLNYSEYGTPVPDLRRPYTPVSVRYCTLTICLHSRFLILTSLS